MIRKILLLTLAILLTIGTVMASNPNVTAEVDTTVVNSTFLDVQIWLVILFIGIGFFLMSHVPGMEKSSAIWAVLAPFFTFSALWFSNKLQYTVVVITYNSAAGTYNTLAEHYIYHLDWLSLAPLGALFLFSFINIFYVITRKTVEKPQRKEIDGTATDNE